MTNYDKLLRLLQETGMDKKWSQMFVKKLSDDEKAFPTDDETKKWALTKGFYPGRVELYGLTEENYHQYLPDYGYFMIHPINHHFRIWVNDKLSLKYVLNSNDCEDTMPKYYLYVENNGCYTYLMDAPNSVARNENFIFYLLKEKGTLAIKPNSGTSGGRGFVKLEYKEGHIIANNKEISVEEFNYMCDNLENNIVTEYAYQHKDLAKIWPHSECTLRVIMAKIPNEDKYAEAKWYCTVSYARFGSSVSGGASNLSSGGIGVGFDFETGKYHNFGIRYKRFCSNGEWKITSHPDTGIVWNDNCLPNWQFVKSKIQQVCKHISSLDYLGLDIIITPKGFKFCEINTHPAGDYEQVMCGPILRNEEARIFFENKGLYKFNPEEFYRMYIESQED